MCDGWRNARRRIIETFRNRNNGLIAERLSDHRSASCITRNMWYLPNALGGDLGNGRTCVYVSRDLNVLNRDRVYKIIIKSRSVYRQNRFSRKVGHGAHKTEQPVVTAITFYIIIINALLPKPLVIVYNSGCSTNVTLRWVSVRSTSVNVDFLYSYTYFLLSYNALCCNRCVYSGPRVVRIGIATTDGHKA